MKSNLSLRLLPEQLAFDPRVQQQVKTMLLLQERKLIGFMLNPVGVWMWKPQVGWLTGWIETPQDGNRGIFTEYADAK